MIDKKHKYFITVKLHIDQRLLVVSKIRKISSSQINIFKVIIWSLLSIYYILIYRR